MKVKKNSNVTLVTNHLLKQVLWRKAFIQFICDQSISLCTIFTILLTLWNSEQKNGLLIKKFCFSSDFDETWGNCSTHGYLQLHQVWSKSEEKQKSFINSPFFCSEFQSVSRIVKIVHSAYGLPQKLKYQHCLHYFPFLVYFFTYPSSSSLNISLAVSNVPLGALTDMLK